MVILNLEAQEIVNGSYCLRIFAGDSNTGSVRSLLDSVLNLAAQPFHCGNARWSAGVYQHGSVEVSAFEHACDVLEMFSNLVAAARVSRIVGERLDASPVFVQAKVMRGLLM